MVGSFQDEWDAQRRDHEDFTNGEWTYVFGSTSNRILTSRHAYIFFKLLEALFVTLVMGWTLYDRFVNIDCGDKYLLYLTHWSLVLQVYWGWISLWGAFRASFAESFSSGFETMPMSVGVGWVFSDVLLPLTCFVSALYWLLVYPHQTGSPGTLTYLTHGANFLVMALDAFIGRVPYLLLHGVYFAALCAAYVIFTIFYWAFGGIDCSGNHFILKDLDWNHPSKTGTILGIALFALFPMLNLLFWYAVSQLCPSEYRLSEQEGAGAWLKSSARDSARKRGSSCGFCCRT